MQKRETKSSDLTHYPATYLRCRDSSHHWDEVTFIKNTRSELERVYRCTNCTMVKHELLDWQGFVYRRWYVLPRGYGMSIAVTKRDVRVEYMRRRKIKLQPTTTTADEAAS